MGNNRSSLFHPPLKTGGGTTLWNHIDTIYQILSDNDVGRWVTFTALANSGVKTITHGFGVPFDDLTVLVYTGAYPNMTRSTAFTVTANAASPKTKIDITAPSSGGPFSGAVLVIHTAAWQQRVVTTAQRTALVSPKPGSFVYDSDVGSLFVYKDSAWVAVADVSSAQTFTNKNISGADNDITNVSLTTGVTGVLPASKGGTGVSNADAATLTRTGDHDLTLTTTAPTSVTLPTTGTLSTLAGAEVFTNKDYDGGTASNTSRLTLPKASKTILDGLTRKKATLLYGEDTNKVYADDGSTLKEIGSGSSGINYLSAQFAADALGSVELSVGDTLATTTRANPTQWGSSAATALIAQSTNSTLRGTTNYLVSFSANAQFVESPLFTIDGSDLAKPLTVSFDVSGVATADDVQVYVARYNSSNVLQERTVIAGTASATSPNSAKVPTATTSFRGFFIPSATATDKYAIRWRRNANNTSLRLDSLFVGPQSLSAGVAITESTLFAPIFTNSTGLTFTGSGQYQRVANSLVLNLSVAITGTGSVASPLRLNLPVAGITAVAGDYAGGNAGIKNADINNRAICVRGISGQNYVEFSSSSTPSTSLNGNAFSDTASSNSFYFLDISATIPISQWSSNVTMADRAVEEYASNSGIGGTNANTNYTVGSTAGVSGSQFVAVTSADAANGFVTKYAVNLTNTIIATTLTYLEFTEDGGSTWSTTSRLLNSQKLLNGNAAIGMWIEPRDSTSVWVVFGNAGRQQGSTYGSNGISWGGIAGNSLYKWRLRAVQGGAAVGYPVSARNIVGDTSGTAVPVGYVGEVISGTTILTENSTTSPVQGTYYDVASPHTITLTSGVWRIVASIGQIYTDATGTGYRMMAVSIRTSTNLVINEKISSIIPPTPGFTAAGAHLEEVINITTNTTYKLSYKFLGFSGALTPTVIGIFPSVPTKLYAVRIA